ncbi:Acyl-CoA-binding domain-containing protein 2 [Grifola frondosa]|uniref:Acyl-CoA-binding domain-containing protein 2 n=1 Tax=Grifola frondosa TaxID=5627 RepID=A0A1C7MP04_GRIFR|nr:Acyl-CoA-binding domain-containing protein 2 [Grifola frondosa]
MTKLENSFTPFTTKWDAWRSAGETYVDRAQDAENRYLEIARTLGWSEDKAPEASRDVSERGGEDNIWDDDSATNKRSGDGGMGNFVSTVTHEDTAVSKLSSLAISGNVQGLQSFLDENPRVDVNQPDENGYTPLHLASDRGQLAVVELLLKRGADPDIKDSDNFTAAELAQIAGHDDVLTLLTSV